MPEVLEDAGTAHFRLLPEGDLSVPVTLAYSTEDGTARAGVAYESAAGKLTFAPGETVRSTTILRLLTFGWSWRDISYAWNDGLPVSPPVVNSWPVSDLARLMPDPNASGSFRCESPSSPWSNRLARRWSRCAGWV